jgi:iron(III) transport system ATP-binding protein
VADGVIIRGLAKRFGARDVLNAVDLDVAPGSLTAVLGPSGCGKTTLLRIVAGFAEPDAGTVEIGGLSMVGVPTHRRQVGLLPQEGALFPYLDVGANVAFGLPRSVRGSAAGDVAHWLEVVGLTGYADARPAELSGGQQQRVALARALAARPRVMLLDEPFAALDAGLRIRVREDIAAILAETGTTAVLVTHDQAEALSLADSVALLLDGSVVQNATPTQVYQRPATLAAARFVGATVELPGQRRGREVVSVLGTHPVETRDGPAGDGPVTVVLRPEQLRLAADGAPGRVTDVRYYGATTSVHVALADESTVVSHGTHGAAVAAGADVRVAVQGAVLAYPASPP